jgi:hypothetical protein
MFHPSYRKVLRIVVLVTVSLTAGGLSNFAAEPAFSQPGPQWDVCRDTSRHFIIPLPGVQSSIWEDGTISLAIPLESENDDVTVTNVQITRIQVPSSQYLGPSPLPTPIGAMPADELKIVYALFSPAQIQTHDRYPINVGGTYTIGTANCQFEIHDFVQPSPPPPGLITATNGTTTKTNPLTTAFPPAPPTVPFEPNAETPMFIPIGPARQLFPSTPTGTTVGPSTGGTSPGGAVVQIPRNTALTNAGVPPDPSTATQGPDSTGVVLATYNTGISVSTNGGQTFTDINLFNPQPGNPARTSFFPQSDGGLCCDQVVIYHPPTGLFFWLLQYQPITACATNCTPPGPTSTFRITQPDRIRIAWATPAAISADMWNAWTYVDLTGTNVPGVSSGLGIAANEWLDYPDLAFTNTWLYMGIDHGFPTPGQVYTGRRIVARLSLADIANPGASSVGYQFAELTGSNGLNKTHFVQNAPARMVVGSLDNSSTMRVFTWDDGSNSIANSTVNISQIQQGANYTSTAPDGSDWVAVSFPGNITGGTYRRVSLALGGGVRDEYIFAFDAGVNGTGRPQSYVRLETLTPSGSGFTASSEYDIWNPNYAFAMAALGTDGREIGIALAVGGGTLGYPQGAVGYMDDFVVYQVTASNATQISRFGDYFNARPVPGPVQLFATELYEVILNPPPPGTVNPTCATVGCSARMRFVEWGRPFSPPDPGPR